MKWQSIKNYNTIMYTNGLLALRHTRNQSEDFIPLGKQALVFMAVGDDFKLPMSYFLLNGICSEDRADLTREVIMRIKETGAQVMALTSDGYVGNISCTKVLGADFDSEKPYFLDPSDPSKKIYVIWDPCHMLKLARNCFGSKLLYHNGNAIRWELLEYLNKLQSRNIVKFGNKLGSAHINWRNRPMRVPLAAETLSDSIADALVQCNADAVPGFEDVEATVDYIRMNNNIFDIMNSRKNQTKNTNFKRPMSPETKQEYFEYFSYVKTYLKELVIEQVKKKKKENIVVRNSVFATKSHTAFFGHYNNILASEGLYTDYVENGPLEQLNTFQFSQDHLETFFGTIRRIHGCSDNPTPVQFEGSFRKLLVCNGLLASEYSNIINNETSELTISSRKKSKVPEVNLRAVKELEIDFCYDDALNEELSVFDQHIIAILASSIEFQLVKHIKLRSKVACQKCIEVFLEDYVVEDTFIDKKEAHDFYIAPAKSTFDIVKASNKITSILDMIGNDSYKPASEVLKTIWANLDMDKLFSESNFEDHNWKERHQMTHKEAFICKIVDKYMKIKSDYVSKQYDEEVKKNYIRHKLLKQIHFAGQ